MNEPKLAEEKGEKNGGIRDTAEAEWKKGNPHLASTSEKLP
jgi:hypothetical protein